MSNIATNLRHLRALKSWSQQQLADKLKITRSSVGSYEEERCEPSIETLLKISALFKVSVDVLLKADLKLTDLDGLMKIGENRVLFPILVDRNMNDLVEVITAKASAGYLNGYADPDYVEKLPVMNLPFRVTGKHRAFPIKGDSMPPLKDGSFVITRYVESLNEIVNGDTYVLITRDDGIVYKRVHKTGNILELQSDNKRYDPYKVKAADVLEVWSFVCALNLSDKKADELNPESIMEMLKGMRVEMERIKK